MKWLDLKIGLFLFVVLVTYWFLGQHLSLLELKLFIEVTVLLNITSVIEQGELDGMLDEAKDPDFIYYYATD